MICTMRWEVCRLFEPWAAPQASLVGPPMVSGTVVRNDQNESPPADSFFAATDPIIIPTAIEGERSLILVCEVFGARAWLVAIGTPDAPPSIGSGLAPAIDPHPCILIPPSGVQGSARSREVRAVRPGALVIAQPSRT